MCKFPNIKCSPEGIGGYQLTTGGYWQIPADHWGVRAGSWPWMRRVMSEIVVPSPHHFWSHFALSLSPPLRHRSSPPLLPRPRPNSKLSTPLLDTLIPTPSSLLKLRSCHIRSPLLRKSASNIFEGLSVGLVLLICECVVECC